MQLFYHPTCTQYSETIVFSKEESKHIVLVLRKKEGDTLHTTNGNGLFFTLQLTVAHPKKSIAKVLAFKKQPPLPYSLHLAVAPTKSNDRFEWFLEKATEIGITQITPIICDRSERKIIKPERYEKIIISAMKQSVKAYKPLLNNACTFSDFVLSETVKKTPLSFIAHCEEDIQKKSLKRLLLSQQDVIILIGPEGDFSPEEIAFAKQHHIVPVHLGTSRLRTETAAVVACHSVAFVNE